MVWHLADKLHLENDSTHNLSFSLAMGMLVGFSPLLGAHILIGVILIYWLRLNKVAVLAGVLLTNPWTIAPIYTFSTWIGGLFTGQKVMRILVNIKWRDVKVSELQSTFQEIFWSFFIGSWVVAVVMAVLTYFLMKNLLEKKKLRAERKRLRKNLLHPGIHPQGHADDTPPVTPPSKDAMPVSAAHSDPNEEEIPS